MSSFVAMSLYYLSKTELAYVVDSTGAKKKKVTKIFLWSLNYRRTCLKILTWDRDRFMLNKETHLCYKLGNLTFYINLDIIFYQMLIIRFHKFVTYGYTR